MRTRNSHAAPSPLPWLTPLLVVVSLAGLACSSSDDDPGGASNADLGPDGSACPDDGSGYDTESQALECEVLRLTNQRRAAGAHCGEKGSFDPTGQLQMSTSLRAAARKHVTDMATREYLEHDSPEGVEFSERISAEGYVWWTAGENIARFQRTADVVMNEWMASDGHCANIMDPDFEHIGVGHDRTYWAQEFGATP